MASSSMGGAGPSPPGILRSEDPDQATDESRKRSRIRFSCTACREKKLKCNRQLPCDQCTRRGVASACKFVPYVSGNLPRSPRASALGTSRRRRAVLAASATEKGTDGPGPTALARLRHLEHLVQILKAQRQSPVNVSTTAAAPDDGERGDGDAQSVPQGKAGLMIGELRYVDASNWEAVLSDTVSIAKRLTALAFEEPSDDNDENGLRPPLDRSAPELLRAGFTHASIQELRRLLPPRHVADRLLARFFDARGPSWVMFHTPTFMKRYNDIWENPTRTSYTQLALVFTVLCSSAAYHVKGGEEIAGGVGDAADLYKAYKARAAQCLALSDYTKPGQYKVEALLLYFSAEYLLRPVAGMGGSMILAIALRLAMHMGMHRDPSHYPKMTPFEGEMRRRVWTFLRDLDALVAFQLGLPSNIHSSLYDTAPPRNLHDEDFDQETKVLPPSRPETERTRVLWQIVKSRLLTVFCDVSFATNSRNTASYADVCRLGKRLDEAYGSIPSSLRHRPFSQSVADAADLVTQRYQLELVYNGVRMVLHRRYIGYARNDKRYEHSRRACLDAATQTLRHQYDLHCEHQPGGRFAADRSFWLSSSFTTHNFLLAAMIVCLELWSLKEKEKSGDSESSEIIPKEQLLDMLRSSRLIWESRKRESVEENRVFRILTKMISMSTGETFNTSSSEGGRSSPPPRPASDPWIETRASGSLGPLAGPHKQASPWVPVSSVPPSQDYTMPISTDFTALDPTPTSQNRNGLLDPGLIGDWVGASGGDWSQWDSHILNTGGESSGEIPWDTFFQPACRDQERFHLM